MSRFPLVAFAAGSLLGPFVFSFRQEAPAPPRRPWPVAEGETQEEKEQGLTPRERFRRKVERDLEGVWDVVRVNNPAFSTAQDFEGYFLFYRGYVAFTVTAMAESRLVRDAERGMFQSGFKKYAVTDEGRLLLQNMIGVHRLAGATERLLGGESEEREVLFEEDTIRIARAPDDYVELRRVPTELPKPPLPFPKRRALTPPGPDSKPATGATSAPGPGSR